LLFISAHALSLPLQAAEDADNPLTRDDLIDLITKVTPVKSVYIQYDTVAITQPLMLNQIEATIDVLATKLSSLRFSSSLENLQPAIVVSGDVVLTVFQTVLPLPSSLQACNTLGLEPLTLSNLPIAIQSSFPILLQYDISVGTNSISCLAPQYSLRESDCLNDLLNRLAHALPFQNSTVLRNHLLSTYPGNVAHLVIYNQLVNFTVSPYGNSACIGQYDPLKLHPETSKDVMLLHEHFYEKLNMVFVDIYDYLDVIVSHLSDTIHSITSEVQQTPIPLLNAEKAVTVILENLPVLLPNYQNKAITHPHFEAFFQNSLKYCPDMVLAQLTKDKIQKLSVRQRNILLHSLMQFRMSLKNRMTAFTSAFNLFQTSLTLPNTLLFHPEQNPSTFVYMARGILPNVDENLLTEMFILLQNEKASLLQDVPFLYPRNVKVTHLTRAGYSALIRNQKLDFSPKVSELKPRKLKFLQSPRYDSNRVFSIRETEPFAHHPVEIHTRNMSLKHILSSLYNKERVSLTPHPPSVVRQKRSWGSFWGGLFDLGTQDGLEKIKDHELAISNSELSLANSLSNITDVNTHLLNSLQTVSSSVNSLNSSEKKSLLRHSLHYGSGSAHH
jgi:hypothetical protein